jgi:hypothetical protein
VIDHPPNGWKRSVMSSTAPSPNKIRRKNNV